MAKPNEIFQYSIRAAYQAGLHGGGPPVAFLSKQGNHGLGLGEDGSGDMLQIDGTWYTLDADGGCEESEDDDQLPFVMTTVFQPQHKVKVPPRTTNTTLEAMFESAKNTALSFRLRGTFTYMHTQSDTLFDSEGTVFGFRVPSYQAGLSGQSLQCAFLSKNREIGGVVVGEFVTGSEVTLEWAKCARIHYTSPQGDEFDELEL